MRHGRDLNRDPTPQRTGHMLMFTPGYQKSEAFFTDVLILLPTDRAQGKVSFMAAGEGIGDIGFSAWHCSNWHELPCVWGPE